ncbi:MAG TPA: tetratricopeptide repeat protein [Candidatus Limnocylindrales bacterium]|nr:tetratricopeptide repeat protein [Candidatus Limnocylindrales bacterium]
MIAASLRARRPRPIGILATALLLAAGTLLAGWSGPGDRSRSPTPGEAAAVPTRAPGGVAATPVSVPIPGAGAATLPDGSFARLDRNIRAWTLNLEANPQDFLSATNLATLYQGRARLSGDLGDHERALEAARVALALAPDHAPARALEASIRYSLHDFRGALASADALYRDDAGQLGALATRADAAMELGDVSAAATDLDVLRAAAPGPAVGVRLARLRFLSGDLEGAVEAARDAREAAAAGPSDDLGFYEYALGEYARLAGDAATARAGYVAALEAWPRDLGARIGLVRILAFEGDLDGAIAGLEVVVATAPLPEAEALLGDLLLARAADPSRGAGERAADRAAVDVAHGTVRLTSTISALAGSVYDRQLLRFALDHDAPSEGLLEATRNSAAERPDAAGRELVGWALYRLGRVSEAWVEVEAARAAGATDARTLFHAGAISLARGDELAAADLLDRALALGPALDPAERSEAARLRAGIGSGVRG